MSLFTYYNLDLSGTVRLLFNLLMVSLLSSSIFINQLSILSPCPYLIGVFSFISYRLPFSLSDENSLSASDRPVPSYPLIVELNTLH